MLATHPDRKDSDERTRTLVRYGASPRAGQAIVRAAKARALLDGRPSVSRDDLLQMVLPALRHRVMLTFEAESQSVGVAELMASWIERAEKRS